MEKKHFYINKETNSFAVATNFDFKETPQGYEEITQNEFEALQEELNKEGEENDNTSGN